MKYQPFYKSKVFLEIRNHHNTRGFQGNILLIKNEKPGATIYFKVHKNLLVCFFLFGNRDHKSGKKFTLSGSKQFMGIFTYIRA